MTRLLPQCLFWLAVLAQWGICRPKAQQVPCRCSAWRATALRANTSKERCDRCPPGKTFLSQVGATVHGHLYALYAPFRNSSFLCMEVHLTACKCIHMHKARKNMRLDAIAVIRERREKIPKGKQRRTDISVGFS